MSTLNVATARTILLTALNTASAPMSGKDLEALLVPAAGGDAKKAGFAWNNASYDLKHRGCAEQPARGMWSITDAGRAHLAGGPLPEPVREVKPRAKSNGAPAAPADAAPADAAPAPAVDTTTTSVVDAAPAAPKAPRKPRAPKGATVAAADVPAPVDAAPAAEAPAAPAAEAPAAPVAEAPAAVPAPPATEAAAEAPAKPKGKRLKVAQDVTAVPVPDWFADEQLRGMVADQTECFGSWSARSAECGKCPLSGWCRNAKAAALTMLASKITAADPANPGAVKPAVAKLDAAVDAAAQTTKTVPDPAAGTMTAKFDSVCVVTGKPIKKGDAVKFIHGKGLAHANA